MDSQYFFPVIKECLIISLKPDFNSGNVSVSKKSESTITIDGLLITPI